MERRAKRQRNLHNQGNVGRRRRASQKRRVHSPPQTVAGREVNGRRDEIHKADRRHIRGLRRLRRLCRTALAAGARRIAARNPEPLYNKDQIDPQQPIGPSAYRDWKPKKGPPWTIGYASSYAGNTWRAAALEHLEKDIIPKWKKLGLIKDVIVTQSNLKDSTQIQQMRQLVDRGVDALIICCSNPTAINETVKYAYDKGVPTFSMVGYVTSPYAVNSSTNFVVTGKQMGEWLVEEIGKKGNVLVVEGIPGTSTSNSLDRGIKAGTRQQRRTSRSSATSRACGPTRSRRPRCRSGSPTIPAISTASSCNRRPSSACCARWSSRGARCRRSRSAARRARFATGAIIPNTSARRSRAGRRRTRWSSTWNIMMRTMQGQGPKIQSMLVDADRSSTMTTSPRRWPENCSESSDKWFSVGVDKWGGKDLDTFLPASGRPEGLQA